MCIRDSICGGTLEVFVEPILPQPRLYIFGGGHVSTAVAKVASLAGFWIGVVDDRASFANAERFPMAGEIYTSWEDAFAKLQPNASTYIVIVTRGHKDDMRVLEWAAATDARYIGMIGSKRKVLAVYKALEATGISAEKLEHVYAPVGLEIGALTPEEIAVSIDVYKRQQEGVPGFECIVERARVESLWDALLDAVRAVGGGPIGYNALNTLRLEAGIPWFGHDFDENVIPHEADVYKRQGRYLAIIAAARSAFGRSGSRMVAAPMESGKYIPLPRP